MMDQENGLPEGWVLLPIKSLGKTVTGNTPPTKELNNYGGDIPFIKPSELIDQPVSAGRETISDNGAEKARIMPKDGVLVSCIGNLGKTAIAKRDVAFNQQINAIVFNQLVIPEYGFYYFQTVKFHKDLESLASATTISIVNKSKFESIYVPVASLEQQNRIVAEIEKQLSRLDEAVAGLKCIQANLKRYRASVLKAAVEGKLTAEWRKQHPDTEPAEQLLQRILRERRAHWEQAELEKMQAAGKLPKDEQWKQKYKVPVKPDMSDLPALPDGWVWTNLEQTSVQILNGFGKRKGSQGTPKIVLRLADIKAGRVSLTKTREIYASQDEIEKYELQPNDILIVRVNGSLDIVGRLVLFETQNKEVLYCDHFMRIRLMEKKIAQWLRFYGDSSRFRKYIELNRVSSAGQNTVNQGILNSFPIPFPPLLEQLQITKEMERRLSIADEVEQQINTNLKRAERLRQAILKKAFSGRLVPQDPDDEPADVLLEKIKQAQRA